MAFGPGQLNITKLLQFIEEGKAETYKSKDGDDMLKVNINFNQPQFISMGGFNANISLFNRESKCRPIFGSFKVDYEHLRKDGII